MGKDIRDYVNTNNFNIYVYFQSQEIFYSFDNLSFKLDITQFYLLFYILRFFLLLLEVLYYFIASTLFHQSYVIVIYYYFYHFVNLL